MLSEIRKWLASELGANLAEYALLGALIAVVALLAISFVGAETSSKLAEVGSGF